jgi:hypothetical protein
VRRGASGVESQMLEPGCEEGLTCVYYVNDGTGKPTSQCVDCGDDAYGNSVFDFDCPHWPTNLLRAAKVRDDGLSPRRALLPRVQTSGFIAAPACRHRGGRALV